MLIWLTFVISIQKTGKQHIMPINSSCLESAAPSVLNEFAERYEAIALEMRKSSEQLA